MSLEGLYFLQSVPGYNLTGKHFVGEKFWSKNLNITYETTIG